MTYSNKNECHKPTRMTKVDQRLEEGFLDVLLSEVDDKICHKQTLGFLYR